MIDPLSVAQWRRTIDRLFSEATTLREKFALGETFAAASRAFPACALAFEQIRAEEEERARLHAITGCADPIEARRMIEEWEARAWAAPFSQDAIAGLGAIADRLHDEFDEEQ